MNIFGEITRTFCIPIVLLLTCCFSTTESQHRNNVSDLNHASLGAQEGIPASWVLSDPGAAIPQGRLISSSTKSSISENSHASTASNLISSEYRSTGHNFETFSNNSDLSRTLTETTEITPSFEGHVKSADTPTQGNGPSPAHILHHQRRVQILNKVVHDLSNSSAGFGSSGDTGNDKGNVESPTLVDHSLSETGTSTADTKNTTGVPKYTQPHIATSPSTAGLLRKIESLNHEDKKDWISGNPVEPTNENNQNIGNLVSFTDVKNGSVLVDPTRERDMLTWLDVVNPGLVQSQENSQSKSASNLELGLCAENCTKNKGVCVMGNDFKPHCVVVSDACEQFRCISGDCVSTDGRYRCECYQGWVGPFCDTPCTLDCGENGFCGRLNGNDTLGCICHWNYTGNRCEDKRKIVSAMIEVVLPGNEFKTWEIAVVSVLATIILALTCVLLPYVLWRRQWVPIRKLVFYFQEYEDDDDKEYDAFISYKSTESDERFILHHLYPKLEKELNFKLCLHFRDFPPGEPIANNIIRAIEGSRRTILILSPSFISSEWCRMEYQKAQYEMLKLKHKIIPIIIEDIGDVHEMDKNLKCIIDTVTYITWPGDEASSSSKRLARFWKLLELSMPKRRSESNHSVSSSETSSSEVPLTPVSDASMNSILSSNPGDDFPDCSASGSDSSDLSDSISSIDNTESFKEFKSSKISEPSYPSSQSSRRENVCTISLTQPEGTRREIPTGSDIPEDESSIMSCSASCHIMGSVKKRSTSISSCQTHNAPYGHGQDPTSNRRTDNNGLENKQKNTFISSDDHIVEIRETRPGSECIIVKPRPRQCREQLFV